MVEQPTLDRCVGGSSPSSPATMQNPYPGKETRDARCPASVLRRNRTAAIAPGRGRRKGTRSSIRVSEARRSLQSPNLFRARSQKTHTILPQMYMHVFSLKP
jgi:hypothetical protein